MSHAKPPAITRSLATLLGVLLAGACSGAAAPAPQAKRSGDEPSSCSAREQDARRNAQAAVAEHLACQTDADCMTIAIGNGCFDACTTSINRDGEAAVKTALAASNSAGCSRFVADGCRLEVPPCAPPTPPSCNNGTCQ